MVATWPDIVNRLKQFCSKEAICYYNIIVAIKVGEFDGISKEKMSSLHDERRECLQKMSASDIKDANFLIAANDFVCPNSWR